MSIIMWNIMPIYKYILVWNLQSKAIEFAIMILCSFEQFWMQMWKLIRVHILCIWQNSWNVNFETVPHTFKNTSLFKNPLNVCINFAEFSNIFRQCHFDSFWNYDMAFVKGMETGKSAIISQTIISYLLKIIWNSFESKIFRENILPRELVGEGVNFSFIHNIIYRLIFFHMILQKISMSCFTLV